MPATSWDSRLDSATTPDDVAALCDRYVTAWSFQDLGQLPSSCQPVYGVEAGQVSPYALKLAERLGDRNADAAPMLHRMSSFFTKAAQRMAQIAASQPQPAAASD